MSSVWGGLRGTPGLVTLILAVAVFLGLPSPAAVAQPKNSNHGAGNAHASRGKSEGKPVLFSADEVTYDDQLAIVVARGNVELSQSGHTLLADVVSYNQRSDTVTASGHVSLIDDATGETTFGDYVELHDNMRDGFIRDVRMLLADRSRVAGNAARRTDANHTEVVKGVYSPCDLCKSNPSAPPLWQIRAAKITHDKEEKLIEFYDADLELGGFPVAWTPYMSHPDPTVRRQSGFLPPTIGSNTILGFDATIPYYWAIGPDKDLTFSPIFTSKQGVVIGGAYRQRFSNGFVDIAGSVVESDPNPGPTSQPGFSHNEQLRGHLFANGVFDLNEDLRAGFNIQRTSDTVYLQEYKFGSYQTFLNSRAYLEDFDGRDYGSVFAYDFQSLRVGVSDRTQPIVLPVADYTWAGRPLPWGGRFTTTVDALDLVRETGSTDRRVSLGTQFDLPFTALYGQRFNLVAGLRGDAYYVLSQQLVTNGPLTSGFSGRVFPQIGLEWRYPWVRRDANSSFLIEPIAAIYAAPVGLNPAKIPNDDSVAVDFNDTDLFTRNRFVGFDQVDSGQRIDYGIHGDWRPGGKSDVGFLVGQSYRLQRTSPFAINGFGDGLERRLSDYVGRITFAPADYLDLTYRFRFDQANLGARRQEVGAAVNVAPVHIALDYIQLGNNVRDEETARQQIGTFITVKVGPYWSVNLHGTRDLAGDGHLLAAGVGAQYSDECATVIGTIGQDGVVIGNFRPGTTVLFQLVLKNLGEIAAPATIVPSSE